MGRLLLIVAGTITTVALLILFLLLYRYATQDINKKNSAHLTSELNGTSILNKPQVSTKWIQDLAQKKRPSFSYPVKEIQIELPLVKKSKISETYRLILKKMDDYKLFCVKQIFKRKNVPFALYAEKGHTVVVVHNISLKRLYNIVGYVNSFGIDLQLENYNKKD